MNTRITQTMITRNTLLNIERAAQRTALAQEQMSSGRVINRPSDDPVGTIRAMGFQSDLAAVDQYTKNVDYAKNWVDTTETGISSGIQLLHRARELTLQASSGTLDPESRAMIATELNGIVDDLKTLGNTKVGDTYIFAGTLTDDPPYTLGAVDTYAGNAGQIVREVGPGVQPTINATGAEVFGSDTTGLIAHLREIIGHVQGSTPADLTALQTTAVTNLNDDLNQMLKVQTRVGGLQSRFDRALDRLSEMEVANKDLLSKTVEVDMAKSIVEFNQQKMTYEAALKAGAQVIQPSLMDFLRP